MKAFLCELLFTCVLAAPGVRTVDDLAYGTMLYAYFQGEHEQALVDIMVAERRAQLGEDPERFALAKGSLAFAEGLYRMSEASFAAIDTDALREIDRMRLAFHRARFHYRRADWQAMSAELDGIRFDPAWFGRERHHPEVQFMRAEAALASGNLDAATQALAPLAETEDYLGYGLFNLAIAQRAAGSPAAAATTLTRIADLPLASAAGRDLVARSRLGIALAAYEQAGGGSAADTADRASDAPAHAVEETAATLDARTVLDRLPASSRYREQALALYGNLAMQRGDYRLAARIWLTLQQGDEWHAGRASAGLGLPRALEGLDRPAAALAGYREAAATFEARLDALRDLVARTGDPAWNARLLAASLPAARALEQRDADERGQAQPTHPVVPGVAEVLGSGAWRQWLADEDVNRLLEEWRTLDRMRAWLEDLPERLEALDEVKDERTRRSAAARAALANERLLQRRDMLSEAVARLETEIGALAEPTHGIDEQLLATLADAGERRTLARIERVAAGLQAAPASPDQARLVARAARLRGVMLWDVAEARSDRVRGLVRELDATRARLEDTNARIARVSRAETELAAGAVADFRAVGARASTLNASVGTAIAARETALADAFRRALDQEMAHTADLLLTAQVAIARTSDQLAVTLPREVPES